MQRFCIFPVFIILAAVVTATAQITPEIGMMPLYASAAHPDQSPFAFYLKVTGLNEGTSYEFTARLRQNGKDYGSFATREGGGFGRGYLPLGTAGQDGELSKWVFLRPSASNPLPGQCEVRIRVREAGASTPEPVDFPGPTLLDMSDAGNGSWVTGDDTGGPPGGLIVLVYNGAGDVLGAYAAEDNNIEEGYEPTDGYWKVVVAADTDIVRVEVRDFDNSIYAVDEDPGWMSGDPGTTTVLEGVLLSLSPVRSATWAEIKALFR
ncbi:MAG TPA: hypothetical protein EYP53_01130 [Candidatus Latescibacteria bacterium]|nr:hypothetical protein [Candidatus Latescibacterota bacterium]